MFKKLMSTQLRPGTVNFGITIFEGDYRGHDAHAWLW